MYMKNRKQKCHAESLLLSISSLLTKQRDPEQKHLRMTQGGAVHGFTLIELLVVVLIIGILSAIALPQYQKTVEKTKAVQAWALLKYVADAQQSYYLANGNYARTFDELGAELPLTGNTKCRTDDMTDTRSNEEWSLQIHYAAPDYIDIMIGRLTGPYAGAGFIFTLKNKDAVMAPALGIIECAEMKSSGIIFDPAHPNAYCKGIFGATLLWDATVFRHYLLP
jgi:prepilin-type N-terminal cleavage/methylation domain-containing protein